MEILREVHLLLVLMSALPLLLCECIVAIAKSLFPKLKTRKDVSNRVVLITGAGSGIGRLLALEFSKLRAIIVLLDVNKNGMNETKNMMMPSAKAFIYECDVSNRHKVYEVAERIRAEVGQVDILVNNAGIVNGKKFLELSDDSIERIMRINTMSAFWMCKAFLPDMMQSNKGHIVSMSSMAGMIGLTNLTDYCASKFATVGFMEALKYELNAEKMDGIKMTTICPSIIKTGLFEGTKPLMCDILEPDYVVSEIMNTVLEEKELLILPPKMRFFLFLERYMPRLAKERIKQKTGFYRFMDSFHGKQTDNNSN